VYVIFIAAIVITVITAAIMQVDEEGQQYAHQDQYKKEGQLLFLHAVKMQ